MSEFSIREEVSEHELEELRNLVKWNEETYQNKLRILENDNAHLTDVNKKLLADLDNLKNTNNNTSE